MSAPPTGAPAATDGGTRARAALAQLGALFVLGNLTAVLLPPTRDERDYALAVLAVLTVVAVGLGEVLARSRDVAARAVGDLSAAAGALYAGGVVLALFDIPFFAGDEQRASGVVAVACAVTAGVAGALWWRRRTGWLLAAAVAGSVLGLLAVLDAGAVLTAGTGAGVLLVCALFLAAGTHLGVEPRTAAELLAGVLAVVGSVVLVEADRTAGLAVGIAAAAVLLGAGALTGRPPLVPLGVVALAVVLPRVLVPPLGVADGVGGSLVGLAAAAGLTVLLLAARAPGGGGVLALGWLLAVVGGVVLGLSAGTAGLAATAAAFGLLLAAAAAAQRRAVMVLSGLALLLVATPLARGLLSGDETSASWLLLLGGAAVVLAALGLRPRSR